MREVESLYSITKNNSFDCRPAGVNEVQVADCATLAIAEMNTCLRLHPLCIHLGLFLNTLGLPFKYRLLLIERFLVTRESFLDVSWGAHCIQRPVFALATSSGLLFVYGLLFTPRVLFARLRGVSLRRG